MRPRFAIWFSPTRTVQTGNEHRFHPAKGSVERGRLNPARAEKQSSLLPIDRKGLKRRPNYRSTTNLGLCECLKLVACLSYASQGFATEDVTINSALTVNVSRFCRSPRRRSLRRAGRHSYFLFSQRLDAPNCGPSRCHRLVAAFVFRFAFSNCCMTFSAGRPQRRSSRLPPLFVHPACASGWPDESRRFSMKGRYRRQ